jgi:hypothetical protein
VSAAQSRVRRNEFRRYATGLAGMCSRNRRAVQECLFLSEQKIGEKMATRKAIIIDVPIRKFMEERPWDQVVGRAEDLAIEKRANTGDRVEGPQVAAICMRRRANGQICGRPADGGKDECWLHAEWYSLLPAVFGMPYPEDAVAIHQILARTMSMVISGERHMR